MQTLLNMPHDGGSEEVKALQDMQRAVLNILEDIELEKSGLEDYQRATFNILDDLSQEHDRFNDTQRALLNILDDFGSEKSRLEQTQRATLNILDDFNSEKEYLESAHRASMNILEDFDQEKDKVDQVNRELKTMLYIISHDLKEPLRSIEYFSTALQQRYADSLDDKGKSHLQRIVRASSRMRGLLDDIMTLSRARLFSVGNAFTNGRALVNAAIEPLESKISHSGATVKISNQFPKFKVERTWATQALYNLIANALRYTNDGQPPDLEIVPYRNSETGQSGIAVRDRGPGISDDNRERIFELFQRAAPSDIAGNGAGLAIVREVAQRHSGAAWVEPRAGGGSNFFITFGPDFQGT